MKKALFNDLLQGVREAGDLADGKRRPSRHFKVTALDVKALRRKEKA